MLSGTSYAAAFVTGAATTLLAEDNSLSPSDIIDSLLISDKWSKQGLGANNHLRILKVGAQAIDENNLPVDFLNDVTTSENLFGMEYIDAYNEITATNLVSPGSSIHYRAGNRIRLSPGFHAVQGSMVKVSIEDCVASVSYTHLTLPTIYSV